jgi:hypothetical protein
VAESKELARAWVAFEKRNLDFKKSNPGQKLDKPFYHIIATGERFEVKTVEEGINRIANTMSKPSTETLSAAD